MRVQQCKVPLTWLDRSPNIFESLYAYMAVAPLETLIDDGGIGTRVAPLVLNEIDENGIMFVAKDKKTMLGGLRAVGSGNRAFDQGYNIHGAGNRPMTGIIFSWDSGSTRRKSKAGAALSTVAHNLKSRILKNDHLESVSSNVAAVSRDGLMLQRGTMIFLIRSWANSLVLKETPPFTSNGYKVKFGRSINMSALADMASSVYGG